MVSSHGLNWNPPPARWNATSAHVIAELVRRYPCVPADSGRFESTEISRAAELSIADPDALHRLVGLHQGEPIGCVLTELLAAAGRDLERSWRRDLITATERSLGMSALSLECRWLSKNLPVRTSPLPGRVLIVDAPIAVPSLEPTLFASYAYALGWSVAHAVGPHGVVDILNREPIDLVLLSVTRISDLRHALACVRDGSRTRFGMDAQTYAMTSPLCGSIARRAGRIVSGLLFDPRELIPIVHGLESGG